MINFKNQEDIMKYLANNSKHYTPQGVIKIIAKQLKRLNIDWQDKEILETSVGEAHLLAGLIEELPEMKNANFTIHDLEEYNISIAKQRLELLGCENIKTYVGDFMEFNHNESDFYYYDFCFQNPPYGIKIEFTVNDFWKDNIGLKKSTSKSPETAFLKKVSQLAQHSFSILPVGTLFRTGWENKVVKDTIDSWKKVTLLAPNLFTTTSIPVIIVELNNTTFETLRITDATDYSTKQGKINVIEDKQVEEIDKIINGELDTHITKLLHMSEIEQNKFNLNVTRYVQRVKEEQIDLEELSIELDQSLTKMFNMFNEYTGEPNQEINVFKTITKKIKEDLK